MASQLQNNDLLYCFFPDLCKTLRCRNEWFLQHKWYFSIKTMQLLYFSQISGLKQLFIKNDLWCFTWCNFWMIVEKHRCRLCMNCSFIPIYSLFSWIGVFLWSLQVLLMMPKKHSSYNPTFLLLSWDQGRLYDNEE